LTGKYNKGIPENSRVELWKEGDIVVRMIYNQFMGEENKENYIKMLAKLKGVADKLKAS